MWLQAMTEHDNAGEDVEEEEDVEDRDISKLNVSSTHYHTHSV